MTRFARAKGSKSSNEKVPEEATPWSQLKRGIAKREKPVESVKKLVLDLKTQISKGGSPEWVSLDDATDDPLNILKAHLKKGQEKRINSNLKENISEDEVSIKQLKRKNSGAVVSSVEKKKKVNNETQKAPKTEQSISEKKKEKKKETTLAESSPRKQNPKKSVKKEKPIDISATDNTEEITDKKKKKKKIPKSQSVANTVKVEKNNIPDKAIDLEPKSSKPADINIKKASKKIKKNIAAQKCKNNASTKVLATERKVKSFSGKKANFKDTTTAYIGGEMVTLMKCQGYYIKKEDATRLKELRKKLIDEGVAQSQIESVIQLERRRCEKALARMRKNVCFHCRKSGHILSQCPEMKDNLESGTGICYKCGSTEHKAFACKVTQGKTYPFAECFICKEKGHIARECPDNPRGLYPNGGCCKLCGSVVHLKKDCPKRISENEEQTIKLAVRDDRSLEELESNATLDSQPVIKKEKKKLVQF